MCQAFYCLFKSQQYLSQVLLSSTNLLFLPSPSFTPTESTPGLCVFCFRNLGQIPPSMTTTITSITSTPGPGSFQLLSLLASGLPEICTPQSFLSCQDTILLKTPNSIGFPFLLGYNPQSSQEPPRPSCLVSPLQPHLPSLAPCTRATLVSFLSRKCTPISWASGPSHLRFLLCGPLFPHSPG